MQNQRVLVVVMDGVGERAARFGNAVQLAWTPAMHWLKQHGLYTTLRAHGTAVGLPSDSDIGNSLIQTTTQRADDENTFGLEF